MTDDDDVDGVQDGAFYHNYCLLELLVKVSEW